MRIVIALTLVVFSISLMGCINYEKTPEKVPAFKISLLHYIIEGKHIVKIQSVEKINVSPSKIKMYAEPPYPGLHVFSIYSKGISDVAYIPIDKEGENLTVYFTYNPKKSPRAGEEVLIIVEVRDGKGKTLANDAVKTRW